MLRSRNAWVTRRCVEESQVILVIASEIFHRICSKVRFTSRNVSIATTYARLYQPPTRPVGNRPSRAHSNQKTTVDGACKRGPHLTFAE
jgi:hypothetical protein